MRLRIAAFLVAACMCLCACAGQGTAAPDTQLSSQEIRSAEENAVLLTRQIALSVFNPADLQSSGTPSPQETDMERFAISTLLFTGEESYLYRDFYPTDDEGYVHLPRSAVKKQLFEVFGCEHDSIGSGFGADYNAETEEYTLMSGFGIGNGYECRDAAAQTDTDSGKIAVSYALWTDSSFPDCERLADCESTFLICTDDNSYYLCYLGTEFTNMQSASDEKSSSSAASSENSSSEFRQQ